MTTKTTETQIRSCIRVRFLPPTDHLGSRYSVQDDRPSDNDSWRMIVGEGDPCLTEADAAQAWLDRFINRDPGRRAVVVLHPVAVRWGRDTFFTWDYV